MINITIKATALSGVRGRIDYISNPDRQEHLVATYSSTTDSSFWKELSKHCQTQAKHSTSKKACEAREFMVVLPNELSNRNPEELASQISAFMKDKTGTENIVALHWNKSKTNFHTHIICAENKEINQVKEGAELTRDTYFDAAGKRSTKKKCVNQDTGELLPGCKLILKGTKKTEFVRFGAKEQDMASGLWLADLKYKAADWINQQLGEDRLQVYKNDGMHLKQQHVGNRLQDESKKAAIRAKNDLVKEWNRTVDMILVRNSSTQIVEGLKHARNDIKQHRLTPSWLMAIQFHLQRWQELLQQWLQKEAETIKTASESLSDRLQRVNSQKQNKNTSDKPRQSRGHNMSL